MRIERLTIENFRSIRRVELADIPDIAVFYGRNGAGKSNLLAGIRLTWALAHAALSAEGQSNDEGLLSEGDRRIGARRGAIRFSARFSLGDRAFQWEGRRVLTVSLVLSVSASNPPRARIEELEAELERDDGAKSVFRRSADGSQSENADAFLEFVDLCGALADALRGAVLAVPDVRGGRNEPSRGQTSTVTDLAFAGRIEEAAARALLSPDPNDVLRLDRLKEVLTAPPLSRPPFRPVQIGGRYTLQEVFQRGNATMEIPLERAGLGVRQLYPVLGGIVLSGAPIVTLEEPEAHLHALTTGLQLREVLRKLVPGTVNQLFVATHSELFDLDPTGYYEVSLDETGCTQVERRTDLVSLDERHTYMPGGARHALMDALRRGEPDRPVFYRPDGTPVVASKMIEMLVEDHPDAIQFLKDVTAAAVRLVAVRPRGTR